MLQCIVTDVPQCKDASADPQLSGGVVGCDPDISAKAHTLCQTRVYANE